MLDQAVFGLERPGAVVRELSWRAREPAQHHGRAARLVLTDAPHEVRRHPHKLARAVLALELTVASGELNGHVLGADRRGALGVARLQRGHECAGGLQRFRHWGDYYRVRQARGLVPYAAFAVLVVGATVV